MKLSFKDEKYRCVNAALTIFLQVSASNDKFMIQLELPGFLPEDFSLKTKDDIIVLEALHQAKSDGDSETTSRYASTVFK